MVNIKTPPEGGFVAVQCRWRRFIWGLMCLVLTAGWLWYALSYFIYEYLPFVFILMLVIFSVAITLIIATNMTFLPGAWLFSPQWTWTSFVKVVWDPRRGKASRRIGFFPVIWFQRCRTDMVVSWIIATETYAPIRATPRWFVALKLKDMDRRKLFEVPEGEEAAKTLAHELATRSAGGEPE